MTSLRADPGHDLQRNADLGGPVLWLAWLGLGALAILVIAVAAVGFDVLFSGEVGLIESQGPLALQPGVATELEQRLFDRDVLELGQRAVHVTGFTLFAAVALVILARRPRDRVILLSSATLLTAGAAMFAPASVLAASRPRWELAVEVLGVFDAEPEFWRSAAGVAIVLFAVLFPDGRFTTTWTKVFTAAFATEVVLWTALPGLSLFDVSLWPDPLAVLWTLGIGIGVVGAQLDRFIRWSGPQARRQTRLVVISLSGAVATLALIWVLSPDLSQSVDLGLVLVTDRLQAIYDLNLLTLLTGAVVLFPVSIGVSVARYRLFDVDLLINRALVYGTLTAMIAVALFGVVAVVGALVASTFGRGLGIAMTGVLMVALFQPLRSRVQAEVDRRFYREKYSADRTVAAFAEQIRDVADLEVLERGLLAVVNATLRPESARAYLRRPGDGHRGVHLSLDGLYVANPNRAIELAEVTPHDAPLQALAAEGVVVLLPLVSHRAVVGVLELGERLGDRNFSGLDFQLLHRLGEAAAPAIRYAQLAEQHAAEALAKQRYEQELLLAQTIQRDLLPKRLPDLAGWEIGALYEPAREVGGDLYDFIDLGDGRWAVVVADVTDKGVPAAMVMATCRSVLRGVATGPDRPGPGEVLRRVNELLIPDTPEQMFVTCFYAVIHPAAGVLSYANAGHSLPVVWSHTVDRLEARGMPLGLMSGMEYEEGERTIGQGENVLFYSDGVTEAHDASGEMFGSDRLHRWLRGRTAGQRLLTDLMSELARFTHPREDLADDVTLVALHRSPAPTDRPG